MIQNTKIQRECQKKFYGVEPSFLLTDVKGSFNLVCMNSYVLHPNGAMIEFKAKGAKFTSKAMKQAVGGDYVAVPIPDGKMMVMQEDVRGLDLNSEATEMYCHSVYGIALIMPASLYP